MALSVETLTGLGWRTQLPAFLVALGHGATHWIQATLYLLLPFVTSELGLSYLEAGTLITIFHLSSFVANFLSGMVVDLLGKRVLIQVASLVIGAFAMVGFGWASSFVMLACFVAVIGATNNLWHPAAISFLSSAFPANRGYALSIHTLGASLGDSLAPLAVGAMLVVLSWQGTAVTGTLPVFAVALLLLVVLTRLDRAAGGAGGSRTTPADYLRGLRDMFVNRGAMGLCLMAGFRSMAQAGLLMFIPIYLANVLQVGPLWTGVGMMALQLGGFVAGPLAGAWSDRIGRRPIVIGGITGTTLVIVFLALAGNEYVFIAGVSVLGFVLFAIRPVIHSWMMDLTPPNMAGSATSALFGTQSALSMLTPVVGGVIADQYGVGAVFYFLAAAMLVANLLVFMLPEPERTGTAH
ncbi:MAG: MFS transporter [Gammaproteobacteria bacterium]|nr:MFS transporter [Gammaproteobacteria bacterium]